jgi:hypothetical protein
MMLRQLLLLVLLSLVCWDFKTTYGIVKQKNYKWQFPIFYLGMALLNGIIILLISLYFGNKITPQTRWQVLLTPLFYGLAVLYLCGLLQSTVKSPNDH